MSLTSALSIAVGGLSAVQTQISVTSQNVANADTVGYVREEATQISVSNLGDPGGVRVAPTRLALDATLQNSVMNQGSTVGSLTTRQAALSAIDVALGSTGDSGTSLPTAVGALSDGLTALQQDPSSASAQQAVVTDAGTVATSINTLSASYATQRQAAEDAIVAAVPQVNASLKQIGDISQQIVKLQSQGLSTADLENERSAQMGTLSGMVSVRFSEQPNGDMQVTTTGGTTLDTHASSGPLSVRAAALSPTDTYPGSIPGIVVGGTDVTASMTGGSIGANIELRDATLPTSQAQLDEFSHTLATRLDTQGLRLFSDGSGNIPQGGQGGVTQGGYVGFSSTIQVNPAVQQRPSLVRDGTTSPSANTGGTAGFTGVIDAVLTYGLGTQSAAGVAQPAENTTGLGPNGRLSSTASGTGALEDLASGLVASQSALSSQASGSLSTEQSVQTALQGRFSAVSGVSVDTEMSSLVALQNAYGANAKVITAIQSMFSTLLNAVNP